MKLLKADFHIHTKYSMDCEMSPEDIVSRCQDEGINCICIADHGTIEGALKMQSLAPFPVIIGEEILTPNGEVMGMFLKETISSGQTAEQVIAQIREQEGLVCLPHPFDPLRGFRLDNKRLEELAGQIDLVEVFNARIPIRHFSTKAQRFARKHGIAEIAGTDSHTLREIGKTYVEIPEFSGKGDFLNALQKASIHRTTTNPLVHFSSTWARLKKSF